MVRLNHLAEEGIGIGAEFEALEAGIGDVRNIVGLPVFDYGNRISRFCIGA